MNPEPQVEIDEKLFYMIKARDALGKIPKDERTCEYEIIYNSIENYILHNCSHFFVNDYIDYTPESSGRITYCYKCMTTQKESV
jgi:hypothetical protein